ncbi:hypothetical protein BGX23_006826 [Mortierella sp. AD031]|nr:hypothetical protein BGX23_006826 [Mortierella sp. AD031]
MSDALDDWEQADEVEIQAPVAAPAPGKKKITLLSRPTGSPGLSGSPGPTYGTGTGAGVGGGGGAPMILRRNPSATATQQQGGGSSPVGRESPFFGDSGSEWKQSSAYRDEVSDMGESRQRQHTNGRSLHERNRALWDQANAYEQPIIARSDTTRTEYVPEIRILRRPKSPVQAVRVSSQVNSKPLAQREADYNAAREKIFGPSPTTTPTPTSTSANNNETTTNITTTTTTTAGSRTHSRGSGCPRKQSPSVGGSGPGLGSSPNSRPSSRPNSRPGSPSIQHQTHIYTAGDNTGAAVDQLTEGVKAIGFRSGPPPPRRGGANGPGGAVQRSGQENFNNAIRQPMGPTTETNNGSGKSSFPKSGRGRGRGGAKAASSSGSGSGSRGGETRQEGSIGFRRPMGRGGSNSPRPPPSHSSSASPSS